MSTPHTSIDELLELIGLAIELRLYRTARAILEEGITAREEYIITHKDCLL